MKFNEANISQEMVKNLHAIGYDEMTPIQEQTLDTILDKKDIIAKAKTGSGKTAAFGIGLLEHLDVKKFRVQSLVLCPTRELADQVAKELRVLAKFKHNIKILLLCGGESFYKQQKSLSHQAHIIVGTPGRVLKHLNKQTLSLDNLEILVFDEADRMLDMGFIEEIESILHFAPATRQTLLFSATYDETIEAISAKIQNNPIKIEAQSNEKPNDIEEIFIKTDAKFETLLGVLKTYEPENVILFTNTKIEAKELAERLAQHNIDALAIHGDLEQYERNDVLVQFANHSCRILVATDVAARGIDIKELAMVINYSLPFQIQTYTHRIGRTARAGAKGYAITLVDDTDDTTPYVSRNIVYKELSALQVDENFSMQPAYTTLVIEGGKKDKLRAGDILGALTSQQVLDGKDIGKIDIYDYQTYVAIAQEKIDDAYRLLQSKTIKAKKFSIWILS